MKLTTLITGAMCLFFLSLPLSFARERLDSPEYEISTSIFGKSKGKPKKKNKAKKSSPKSKTRTNSYEKFLNVDVFGGPSLNRVSGDYIDYQEQYYEGGTTKFPTNGTIKSFTWFTAGAQFRVAPFLQAGNGLMDLSFAFGGMYLQKGFTHDITLQNLYLPYVDQTQLKETFKAQYLSTQVLVRYGRALYVDAGLSLDWFLSGIRKQELTRTSEGDSTMKGFQNGFVAYNTITYTLTKDIMKTPSLGWSFALGYNFTRMFGVRWFNTLNSRFFKEV